MKHAVKRRVPERLSKMSWTSDFDPEFGDLILPAQYYGTRRSKRNLGEQRLMLAVIKDAISCILSLAYTCTPALR
jgi:hypothetical protein